MDLLRAPISLIKNLGISEAFLVIAERFLYVFTCIHVHIRMKSPVVSSFKKLVVCKSFLPVMTHCVTDRHL